MKRLIAGSILGGVLLLLGTALSAFADSSNAAVGFGTLFYNGGPSRPSFLRRPFPTAAPIRSSR